MITLQSFPQGDAQSKYYFVNNPIIYTFAATGKSAGAFNVYDVATSLQGVGAANNRIILLFDATQLIRPGDIVIINDTFLRNVTNVTTMAGESNVFIDESIPFASGGTLKSINNYRAEFRVYHGRKSTTMGDLVMEQVGVNISGTPDAEGKIKLNVQPYLKTFVDQKNILNLSKKNTVDRGLWGRFLVQYRERWDGDGKGTEDDWIPGSVTLANMRWWVSGVKQLKSFGAGSAFPFVNSGVLTPESPRVQFTTAFAEPEYYVGYPNEISFIWPEVSGMEFLELKEEKLNPAKAMQSTVITDLLTEGRQEVNRVQLSSYTDPGFVRLSIQEDTEPEEGYVQANYVLVNYFETI